VAHSELWLNIATLAIDKNYGKEQLEENQRAPSGLIPPSVTEEFEQKDLLISSLKLRTFRPAEIGSLGSRGAVDYSYRIVEMSAIGLTRVAARLEIQSGIVSCSDCWCRPRPMHSQ